MVESYHAFNIDVFKELPAGIQSVLDIGCGSGALLKEIRKTRGEKLKLFGVTHSAVEAHSLHEAGIQVRIADLNAFDPDTLEQKFDVIICSHVLEHLYNPWAFVKSVSSVLNEGGFLIVALPNILFYKQRLEFFKGNFKYSLEGGLMDITHFRFFDLNGASAIAKEVKSLRAVKFHATGNFPLGFLRHLMPDMANHMDTFFVRTWPGLFGFQFIAVFQKTICE